MGDYLPIHFNILTCKHFVPGINSGAQVSIFFLLEQEFRWVCLLHLFGLRLRVSMRPRVCDLFITSPPAGCDILECALIFSLYSVLLNFSGMGDASYTVLRSRSDLQLRRSCIYAYVVSRTPSNQFHRTFSLHHRCLRAFHFPSV